MNMKFNSRLLALVMAAVLLASACGDSSGDTAGGTASGSSPATTAAATTKAPAATTTTTEAAATTTTAAATTTTTTTEAPNPLLEMARAVEGSWTGEWNNITFGSTGPITGDFTLDEAAMELVVNSDVGGFVFGASDPDPEMFTLPISAGDHSGTSPAFGDWTLSIDESGAFKLVAINITTLPGGTFTLEGNLSDSGVDATYTVDFGAGEPAVGEVTMVKGA